MGRPSLLVLLVVSVVVVGVRGVDRTKFKTCEHSSFCSRQRSLHTTRASTVEYSIPLSSVKLTAKGHVEAEIVEAKEGTRLRVELVRYQNDIIRLLLNENSHRASERHRVQGALVDDAVLVGTEEAFPAPVLDETDPLGPSATFLLSNDRKFIVRAGSKPAWEYWIGGKVAVSANGRSLLYFEALRDRPTPAVAPPPPEPVVPTDAAGHVTNPQDEQAIDEGVSVSEGANFEAQGEAQTSPDQPQADDPHPKMDFRDAWDESFSSHKDSKPKGPESVGMDVTFHGTNYIYGLPEHASALNLRPTRGAGARDGGSDPFRLYNLDVFEYELDNEMALYGAVPFVMAHSAEHTVGLLWLNAAETWIDVEKPNPPPASQIPAKGLRSYLGSLLGGDSKDGGAKAWTSAGSRVETHWFSESGILDLFFLPGPSADAVMAQYGQLSGTQQLPPLASVGYHQCRWNYKDEEDVRQVNQGFEDHNLPMDILWLDIEHTDAKKYFTWDPTHFPTPLSMQKSMSQFGRKMVVIIDPHIKRDANYLIHSEAQSKGLYVKNADGSSDYEGWCWPGSSSWLDFTRAEVREWWADQFKFENFRTSTADLYVWNDMNEPSVFNGPEITMHKDAKHSQGSLEHRDVHNQYGQLMVSATFEGQIRRHPLRDHRPFVLSRSFFVGSQRYGAVWTGDNAAQWSHLKASVPMLLSLGVGGITFAGADVGGFFKDPDALLLTRWYQAGAFYPFFRAHGHIDTKRREPWLFGQPYLDIVRDALRTRYRLLPYWYTLFWHASVKLSPLMRPMFFEFPQDEFSAQIEDQFMVGPALLVKPVTESDHTTTPVYFPPKSVWYNFKSGQALVGEGAYVDVASPLESIPVFVRGGRIVPLKDRPRRSTAAMANDPFTLLVTLDGEGNAVGDLYVDDGDSFAYQKGQSFHRDFAFRSLPASGTASLTSTTDSNGRMYSRNKIERIVVWGLKEAPKSVSVETKGQSETALAFEFDPQTHVLTIRKPDLLVSTNWAISLSF